MDFQTYTPAELCRSVEPTLISFACPWGDNPKWIVRGRWGGTWGAGPTELAAWLDAIDTCRAVQRWRLMKALRARRIALAREAAGGREVAA